MIRNENIQNNPYSGRCHRPCGSAQTGGQSPPHLQREPCRFGPCSRMLPFPYRTKVLQGGKIGHAVREPEGGPRFRSDAGNRTKSNYTEMPIFIDNNILVVTKDELVPRFYSYDNLKKQLFRHQDKPTGIKRYSRGGGSGRRLLVLFDSLPATIRESLGDPRRVEHILLLYFNTDAAAVEFYSNIYEDAGGKLSTEEQERYVMNASVLNALLALRESRLTEWQSRGRRSMYGLDDSVWSDYSTFGKVLEEKFGKTHTLPPSRARLLEKMRKYAALDAEERYRFLVNKNRGNNSAGIRTEKARALLESMFAHQSWKPDAAEVFRQYEAFLSGYVEVVDVETGEVFDPKGYGKISQRTVSGFLSSWESGVATSRRRTGNRQIRLGMYVPFETLEHPRWAGSIISVDDRQPPFFYAEGKRVWFYCGVDLGSEAITAWVYGTDKEGIITEFYRQMVRNYALWGMPLPYELECESNLNAGFSDSFLKPGAMFKSVRIEANSARSKRCEAYWRPLRYRMEKRREGWLARPFARSESNQAAVGKVPVLPYERIVQECLEDIEKWNNTEHSIYKGMTRWEVFLQKQNPDNANSINWRGILLSLGKRTATSVSMAGQIRFRNSFYLLGDGGTLCTGEKLVGYMRVLAGKDVDIYYLDDNDGEVLNAVVCLRGESRIICEAVPQPRTARSVLEETPQQRKNRELMARYRNTLEGYSKERYHEIGRVAVIDHRSDILNDGFRIASLERRSIPERDGEVEILEETPVDNTLLNGTQISFKKDLRTNF